MEKIHFENSIHLYLQISEKIKEMIKTNQLNEGDKIPTEEQIGSLFNVSRITVRKAIQHLCDENILIKKHGKGTFVAIPTLIDSISTGGSFSDYCEKNLLLSLTKVISKDIIKANSKLSKALKINIDDEIIRVKRLRLINNLPVIFEIDYFRWDSKYILKSNLEDFSLFKIIMENRNVDISYFNDSIYVGKGTDEINNELQCDSTYKYLIIDEIVLSKANEIIYYNEQFIRSDRYKYGVKTYR